MWKVLVALAVAQSVLFLSGIAAQSTGPGELLVPFGVSSLYDAEKGVCVMPPADVIDCLLTRSDSGNYKKEDGTIAELGTLNFPTWRFPPDTRAVSATERAHDLSLLFMSEHSELVYNVEGKQGTFRILTVALPVTEGSYAPYAQEGESEQRRAVISFTDDSGDGGRYADVGVARAPRALSAPPETIDSRAGVNDVIKVISAILKVPNLERGVARYPQQLGVFATEQTLYLRTKFPYDVGQLKTRDWSSISSQNSVCTTQQAEQELTSPYNHHYLHHVKQAVTIEPPEQLPTDPAEKHPWIAGVSPPEARTFAVLTIGRDSTSDCNDPSCKEIICAPVILQNAPFVPNKSNPAWAAIIGSAGVAVAAGGTYAVYRREKDKAEQRQKRRAERRARRAARHSSKALGEIVVSGDAAASGADSVGKSNKRSTSRASKGSRASTTKPSRHSSGSKSSPRRSSGKKRDRRSPVRKSEDLS